MEQEKTGELAYDLVLTIVKRGFADQVVDAAKAAGADGGTVFFAKGTGIHEVEKFLSISIQPEKEIVMNVVLREHTESIMEAIVAAAGLETAGRGLTFVLPIDDIVGIFNPHDENLDRKG